VFQCSVTCGNGIRRRQVTCRDVTGDDDVIPDDVCAGMLVRKPSSTRKCRQKAPCFVSYQWMLTAWSPVTLDVSFISDQSCRKNFLQNSKQLKIIIIIMSIIINLKCTRNTVDCDQSNYTSRIVFSHMILLKFGLTRNNAIRSADPVNPTLEPNMKWTVDRMTPCGDMAI